MPEPKQPKQPNKPSFNDVLATVLKEFATPQRFVETRKPRDAAFQFLRMAELIVRHRPDNSTARTKFRQFVVSDAGAELLKELPGDFGLNYMHETYPHFRTKYDAHVKAVAEYHDRMDQPMDPRVMLNVRGRKLLMDPHAITVKRLDSTDDPDLLRYVCRDANGFKTVLCEWRTCPTIGSKYREP